MRLKHFIVLLMLLTSCDSKNSSQEKVAEANHGNTVDSIHKAPELSPVVEVTNDKPDNIEISNKKTIDPSKVPGADIALKFMDSYVEFCNERKSNSIEWIDQNQYVTNNFKTEHKSLLEEARKDDPELGLGFDPIFDAQDYPEKGFDLIEFDKEGYLTLPGKDWPEFKVVVKVKKEDYGWLLDGAGIINVPKSKRATR
jgi:hypothetical protein